MYPTISETLPFVLHNMDVIQGLESIETNSIDLVVTSPPYNCRIDYGITDDQLPWPTYYAWMEAILDHLYRVLLPGGVLALNVPGVVRWQADHRWADSWGDYDPEYKTHRRGQKVTGKGRIEPIGFKLFDMMQARDPRVREPIIWIKGEDGNAISGNYQMGADNDPYLRPCHEMILLGSKGKWAHRGGTGRRGSKAVPFLDETKDVWFIPPKSSEKHPAIFPVEIPLRLIKLFTHAPDSVILDPFMGLGTTGIAAMQLKRRFVGIELNPVFFSRAQSQIYVAAAQKSFA